MTDLNSFSPEMREKFDSLAPFIQETIMQSSAKFESVKDLEDMADDIIASQNKKQ